MATTYTGIAICPWCGRKVSTLVPKGGDGSESVFHRHYPRVGAILQCEGSRRPVAPSAYVE